MVTVQLHNLRGRGSGFAIHEFPVPPRTSDEVNYCQEKFVGEVYNPYEMNVENSPPPGEGELVESILCLLERKFTLSLRTS